MQKRWTRTAMPISVFGIVLLVLAGMGVAQKTPAGASATAAENSGVKVVARVNGVAITESALLDQMEQLYPSVGAHGGLRPESIRQVRARALDELIIEELAFQDAVASNAVVASSTVEREYQRLRAKYGAQRFAGALRSSGMTPAQYRTDLQRRMTLHRVFQKQVIEPSRMSAAAARAYYDQNLAKFKRPEQVHGRLFLAAAGKDAIPDDDRKAREKAERVYREAVAGKDFGELAEKLSDDAYRVKGGDLGWMHRGRLDPQFEKVLFNLKVGEVSSPFRTPFGYNLLKLEAREEGRQMRFDEVKDRIVTEYERDQASQLRRAFVEKLKSSAKIEVLEAVTGSEFSTNPLLAPIAAQ